MKYMRRTAGYTRTDYKRNTQISKELKITPIFDKILEYTRNWVQRVNRISRNRLPRVMKHYSPTGRRNHGRPLKRLLDTWDRNGSTSGPTPWQIDDDDDKNWYKWGTSGWHGILCKCCHVFRERHLTACPVGAVSTATDCKERYGSCQNSNRLLFMSWHWKDNGLQNNRAPVYIFLE